MMQESKLPLCVYHAACADGFGAAWVFKYHAPIQFEFFAGTYQKPPPDVTGRDVYLVDFSYKRAVVEEMLKTAKSITLIDHHKSAIEDLQPLIDDKRIASLVSIKHSGAMLAWMFWKGIHETPPVLLQHIEDRDLWRFKIPGTREIQAALFSFPYDFSVWDEFMKQDNCKALISDGIAIERKHFKDIKELLKAGTTRMTICGHTVPVCNLPYIFSNDAGHLLADGFMDDGKPQPFAACYWRSNLGWTFSFRSTDKGVDVSEIAKQYGGGGHRNAAGATLTLKSFADLFVCSS